MRRITIILLFLNTVCLLAQTKDGISSFEANIGIGGEPYFASKEFLLGVMDVEHNGPHTAKHLFDNCYDVKISPTISLEWVYNFNTKWAVAGSIGYNKVAAKYFDPFTDDLFSEEKTYMLDILCGLRYTYVRKRIGATVGKRVYALAELGWGSEYFAVGIVCGARLGIGFKF